MSEAEARRIEELLDAIRRDTLVGANKSHWLATDEFIHSFTSRLHLTHLFLGFPLVDIPLERAVIESAQDAGFEVHKAVEGQRFFDANINGVRVSIKSTSAKDLRINYLHISKLCEAAWIQDMRKSSEREERTKLLFKEYGECVNEIFQARYFRSSGLYELYSIPVSLLTQIEDSSREAFNADGPIIPVGPPDEPDLQIKLDRSDAKITITKIRAASCSLLASWRLPLFN